MYEFAPALSPSTFLCLNLYKGLDSDTNTREKTFKFRCRVPYTGRVPCALHRIPYNKITITSSLEFYGRTRTYNNCHLSKRYNSTNSQSAMRTTIISLLVLCLWACDRSNSSHAQDTTQQSLLPIPTQREKIKVDTSGPDIWQRFPAPEGFVRVKPDTNSFAFYLQHLPLKAHGAQVHYFDGRPKLRTGVHVAVVDIDVGKRDLQQCADAIMRLRAEHLLEQKDYENLHFNFTNGFKASYAKWRQGYKIKVDGNKVSWYASGRKQTSYQSFRQYMTMVFSYAGTLSLEKELEPVELEEIQIGDVFIQGGSPGHAIVVVDMVESTDGEEKLFLLAQSYMPAQEIHILQNPRDEELSPWYSNQFVGRLVTPEWIFSREDLKRF